MRSAFRPLAALALAAALPLAGCVFEEDGDRRPIVIHDAGIQSAIFQFDAFDLSYTIPEQKAYVEYDTNIIDQDTYDSGMVLLYADGSLVNGVADPQSWGALPFTFDYDADGLVSVTVTLGYTFRPGVIGIELEASSPPPVLEEGDRAFDFLGVLDMRLVTIPPGEFLRAEGLDFTNYETVRRFYGIR